MKLNKEQVEYINNILNIKFDANTDLNKMDLHKANNVIDALEIRLMEKGFDENYDPTVDGLMCETILDAFGEVKI